jgi:hypothetical protein
MSESQYSITTAETRTNDPTYTTGNSVSPLETNEGDFIMGAHGDLLLANDSEAEAQRLMNFVKTQQDSSAVFGSFGSRIRNIIGVPDSDVVLDYALELLIQDMLDSGFTPLTDHMSIISADQNEIIITVAILDINGEPIEQNYLFDVLNNDIELLGGNQS